jgi:hypothetical protein
MTYSLYSSNGSIKAEDLINQLDINIPLQAAHRMAVRDLITFGMRYSNEDGDVLGAAYHAIGKTEVHEWAKGWVALMTQRITERGGHTDRI